MFSLTQTDGSEVWVLALNIALVQQCKHTTTIRFVGGTAIQVKEDAPTIIQRINSCLEEN